LQVTAILSTVAHESAGVEPPGLSFRFSSGRIVEEWTIVDIATLRKQLS
jgi:hypothetical protein